MQDKIITYLSLTHLLKTWQNSNIWEQHQNENCTHEEIKFRLNSGNACYHPVQNVLSSHPLSKTLKIKIHRTIILPAVLYGCETWSLTLREEYRSRVFENRVLKRISGPRGRKWREAGEHCIKRSFTICTLHQILLG
jgi:hypothetical protein